MKRCNISLLFLLTGLALANPLRAFIGADVPNQAVLEQENLIRREAEKKIQEEILNRILGGDRATVLVNVEVTLESEKKDSATSEGKVDDRKMLGDQDFILPWVPAPKTVNKANEVPKDAKMESASGELASATIRQSVTRFDVTIIHDDSVGTGQLKMVDEAVRSAYVRYEKVIKVLFKPTKFAKFEVSEKIREGFWDFLKPQYLLPGLIALLLLFFLFGPLWQFLRALLKAMTSRKGTDIFSDSNLRGEEQNQSQGEKTPEEEFAEELAAKKRKEEMERYIPFSYIDEKNIKRLIYLVRQEPPEMIALVISYLKPEFVKQILVALPPGLQAKVAMHMAMVKQMTQAEIMAYDKEIKEKVEFLVGGLHSLLKVLDELDHKTRDNILEYLKNERPHLYEKVRRHIVLFEDLVNFPDQAIQLLVRELKAESLAQALREADPAIADKIFGNMSKGATALLKEEMEFSRPLPMEMVEEERNRIVATAKRLEAEERISFRERLPEDFLDYEDLDFVSQFQSGIKAKTEAAAPAADAARQAETIDAAVRLYGEQRYAEALTYFQSAAQADPQSPEIQQYLGNIFYALGRTPEALAAFERVSALSPADEEFRRWLEQFRASLTAPAGG